MAKQPAQQTKRKPNDTYVAATGDDVAARLATLQAAFTEADEKLEMAYGAAERGDPVDVMLDHISHALLPDAVRPMFNERPTCADGAVTYTALFAPLACLEGAMSLAAGNVIHSTLKEAFDLLDWAQTECDSAALCALLPHSQEPAKPEGAVACWHGDELHEVNRVISEAIGVMHAVGDAAKTELLYGAIYAAERSQTILCAGLDAESFDDCEMASAPIGVARAVLDAALQAVDEQALLGAWRLLDWAKTRLDAELARALAPNALHGSAS